MLVFLSLMPLLFILLRFFPLCITRPYLVYTKCLAITMFTSDYLGGFFFLLAFFFSFFLENTTGISVSFLIIALAGLI